MHEHNKSAEQGTGHGLNSVGQTKNHFAAVASPLKSLILQTLKSDGPLSDLGLYCKIRDSETGGLAAVVVMACLELHADGYIEPAANDPHAWQLSNQGLEYIASLKAASGLFHNCQVERCILWRSGYSNLAGEIAWENEDYKIQPHDVPLFKDREQHSGVCDSCFSGWTHPNNSPTPKGHEQIKAAGSEGDEKVVFV